MTPMDIGDWFASTALSGSLLLAVPVALVAGLVSFFSPCVVPLLPGYLSYATGLSGADLESARRGRMVLGSSLFVLGFSVVFVSYGALFGQLGDWFVVYSREISVVLGALTILVGIAFLGFVPWMQRDVRVHRVPSVGLTAAPLLGILFGLGWTPCIGPTLSAVLFLTTGEGGGVRRGIVLTVAYCLGLGVPFVLVALGWSRASRVLGVLRRRQRAVQVLGGLLLVAVGGLMVSGLWTTMISRLASAIAAFEVPL
jgi:cytochrome c-type biogenesis protein